MAFGDIFLPDMGIQIDAFTSWCHSPCMLASPSKPSFKSEVADKQVGAHDGVFQYSAGESRTGGFSFEIDSEVCNVEHITDVDFLQIQTYCIFGMW